ncbi:hypothetical protein JNM05_00140 [bacterium]|nr:hypothetical protein [bacterium]
MELNSKKLERTSRIVHYSISTILALFLILLSNRIIDDLDTAATRPETANFEDHAKLADLNNKISDIKIDIENLSAKKSTIERTIAAAKENYANEKQSFDNWVQTRKTLGSPDKDQEVIKRAKKLDEFYKVEEDWRAQLSLRQLDIDAKLKKQEEIQNLIYQETQAAEKEYYRELKTYEFKVFVIRLLFVGPILAIGIFFFVRFRRHKYSPLFFGFTLFSLYAFFFGLVPYLPSYGGYVRYAVGVILSIGIGYYAIKTIRQFIEQKQAELKISTQERAKNVQSDIAEKALENHFCPSCGKDFLIKKWEFPFKNVDNDSYKLVTDFCRHCGLVLFSNCSACGNKNFAHLPFCSQCGTKTTGSKLEVNEPQRKEI